MFFRWEPAPILVCVEDLTEDLDYVSKKCTSTTRLGRAGADDVGDILQPDNPLRKLIMTVKSERKWLTHRRTFFLVDVNPSSDSSANVSSYEIEVGTGESASQALMLDSDEDDVSATTTLSLPLQLLSSP
jgi:hypothetical protein